MFFAGAIRAKGVTMTRILALLPLLALIAAPASAGHNNWPAYAVAQCDGVGSAPRDGRIKSIKEAHCASRAEPPPPRASRRPKRGGNSVTVKVGGVEVTVRH